MKCVVLAGGGGLRLWPLSTKALPKQFLPLTNSHSMLYNTVKRNVDFCDEFLIMTGKEHEQLAKEELDKTQEAYRVVLETVGRNTAPAIAIAALLCEKEELLFVVPADAQIESGLQYKQCVAQAKTLAENGSIVTFGIKPSEAHTGYGYIKHENFDVLSFKEKPNLETAKEYLAAKNYLWNSGMFMFKSGVLLQELQKYRPDILQACQELVRHLQKEDKITLPKEEMLKIPPESIDYAVMEKSDKIKVVPSDFSWNDIGGLEALADLHAKEDNDNTKIGNKVIFHDCHNNSVFNQKAEQLVVVNGVDDIIVSIGQNAIYITKKGQSQKIKTIIENNQDEYRTFF